MGSVFYCRCRTFSSSAAVLKRIPNDLKGRGKSSQEWLIRQMNDPYVKKAKLENYRARSAYKLLEIAGRVELMRPGGVVVECGAAPGAWSQVALRAVNADGRDADRPVGTVVGVDLLTVQPLPPAIHLQGDFTAAETQRRLLALLPAPPTLVLSDMAPRASGVRQLDHDRILALGYAVAQFALRQLAPNGALLVKLWAGGGERRLTDSLAPFFARVRTLKPAASRTDSAEVYVVAVGFVGATRRKGEGRGTGRKEGAAGETGV
ncbi:rRNA methyltransferase 2, mitochondrial-like [Pollicipes pollicipes]|uniref:rRNA methyltransferase 2, mitochondrial-like n=1 Tax=Pollicipes pollicipes TaxID=41117 RepID=UPI0018854F1E|nr:rRNA methyltransferase 2, mitochondrial-like [Pollicipes pollicipes]